MRESVGTTTIFKFVLIFTLIFSAFLALAVTYNKVYKMKNESISILEKYEGATGTCLNIINNYLKNSGYSTKGNCESGEFGMMSLDTLDYEEAYDDTKYYYCISQEENYNGTLINYHLRLFFRFNLPVFGDLFTFSIGGETKAIKYYSYSQDL